MEWRAFIIGLLLSIYPLYLLIKLGLIYIIYGREEKTPEVNLSGKLHEPPSDLKPYYVDTLVNKTLTPSGRSVSSAILELVRLKYIKISYNDRSDSLGNRKREYYLVLEETKAREISKLSDLEQRLLAFIFQGVGNIASFSEIKTYHIKKASVTREFWKYWEDQTSYQLVKMGYIDKESYYFQKLLNRELAIIGSVLTSIIVFVIFAGMDDSHIFSIVFPVIHLSTIISLCLPFALVFITIVILRMFNGIIYKRSDFGITEFSKWNAFKRWMEDYSVTKNYPIDSLVLWEKYLIYGLAMGISRKALTELPIKYDLLHKVVGEGFGGAQVQDMAPSILGGYSASDFIIDLIEFTAFIPEMFEKKSGIEES